MINVAAIVRELRPAELKTLAETLGIKAKNAEARRAAIYAHPECTAALAVEHLSVPQLRALHKKLNLPVRGKGRAALVARLAGFEHELVGLNEPYATWLKNMETFLRDVRPDSYVLKFHPPATKKEVLATERWLGIRLPDDFRSTLLEFTRQLDFHWWMDDPMEPPTGWFEPPYCGVCSFGLESLRHLNAPVHFSADKKNPANIWAWRLNVIGDGGGNSVTLDLRTDGKAMWLQHDDSSPPHGTRLGASFSDYMDRSTHIGCLGPEPSQVRPLFGARGIRKSGPVVTRYLKWARSYATK